MKHLISIIFLLSISGKNFAQNFYQDTSKFHPELAKLERSLFPEDDMQQNQQIFEGCSTELDKLKLAQRKNRPNPDSLVEQIRKVFYLKDPNVYGPVSNLLNAYLEYFQIEWGWALIKNRDCDYLKEELNVIEAFERVLFGIKIHSQLKDKGELFNYIRQYSDAHLIPVYYRILKSGNPEDVRNLGKGIGAEGISRLQSFSDDEIEGMKKVGFSLRSTEYTKLIAIKYNAFGSSPLEWNYFSPFLEEIKPNILDLLNKFEESEDKNTLDYHLLNYFFKVQLGDFDYRELHMNKQQ